jgi:hypothetical protein
MAAAPDAWSTLRRENFFADIAVSSSCPRLAGRLFGQASDGERILARPCDAHKLVRTAPIPYDCGIESCLPFLQQ